MDVGPEQVAQIDLRSSVDSTAARNADQEKSGESAREFLARRNDEP